MPHFSIVTVCYNGSELISETIESVFQQTYNNFEYIIKDGGSRDNTLEVVHRLIQQYCAEKFTKVASEQDNGIYDAMNIGASMTTGQYICFMNVGDTFASNDVLEKLAEAIKNEKPTYFYGDIYAVGSSYRKYVKAQKMSIVENTLSMPYCHQALFVERDFLINNPFDFNYVQAADYNQCVQLYKGGFPYIKTDVIIANYLAGGYSEVNALAYFDTKVLIRDNNGFCNPSHKKIIRLRNKMKVRTHIKHFLRPSLVEKVRKVTAYFCNKLNCSFDKRTNK